MLKVNHPGNNPRKYQGNNKRGSVILAILSMAALSGIAMLTIMFSIKSLSKTLTIEELQVNAQQILSHENNKHISNHVTSPIPNYASTSSTVSVDGIEYTYQQYPTTIRELSWPIPGFSIKSNYASTLISFKSQIKTNIIQTPILFTGISCIDVATGSLNRNPERHYRLTPDKPTIDSIDYEFNSDTGEIHKLTATSSKLVIDLDFDSHQAFSRADFAAIKIMEKTKLAVIFATTNSKNTTHALQNKLYILFDDALSNKTFNEPLSTNELINLTNDYLPTGHEDGFVVTLNSGQLELSAITTVNNQIIFITQWRQHNAQTDKQTYKNQLYQIDLTTAQIQIIENRLLPDSTESLQLTTHLANRARIVIGTQANPFLLTFPVICKQVFQYEE